MSTIYALMMVDIYDFIYTLKLVYLYQYFFKVIVNFVLY